jgi:3-oxoacyl-[acyl-carrier-protein] synthase II
MMALKDAGLDVNNLNLPSPTPVVIGVSTSALDVIERVFHQVNGPGPDRVSPLSLGASKPQAVANVVADKIGTCANASTVSSACPSGLDAIADATKMVRSGEAEIAIAGGADAPITPLAMASFIASGLSSFRNGEPETASRPFDRSRDSGIISEGAGMVIIENLERARARGARIYLEITGFGTQRDQNSEEPASGLEQSMRLALANAGLTQSDIQFISAYGPSHPVLDAVEVGIIKRVFGRLAYRIPVTSIKGVTGNPLAAGGPFQLAACALTIRDNVVAPTANYELPDPECDLDFVPNRKRRIKVDCALINVRGLGGSASTMVVTRVPEND